MSESELERVKAELRDLTNSYESTLRALHKKDFDLTTTIQKLASLTAILSPLLKVDNLPDNFNLSKDDIAKILNVIEP